MRPSDRTWVQDAVLAIAGIVAAVAGVIYIGYWIVFGVCFVLPYLLFCVPLFALLTATYGYGFAGFCKREFNGEEGGYQSLLPRSTYYRRLAILFPAFVVINFGIFDLPVSHQVVMEKVVVKAAVMVRVNTDDTVDDYGNPVRPKYRKVPEVTRDEPKTLYQWPELVEAFNSVNSYWQDRVYFLKGGKPYQFVLFDRNVFSIISWIALLLTGPMLFWKASQKDVKAEDREINEEFKAAVLNERELWESKQKLWRQTEEKLRQSCKFSENLAQTRQRQIEALTAKLDFTPAGLKIKIEEQKQKPGVLDSDFL